jgi:hypothetical protein
MNQEQGQGFSDHALQGFSNQGFWKCASAHSSGRDEYRGDEKIPTGDCSMNAASSKDFDSKDID